ncbi:hypothetical protein ACQ4PT_003923 [Festuca glaucescens]
MGSPSTSSQSRRWADYTDDEDEVSPRSYCEVLRSGTPPTGSCSRAAPPPARGGARSPSPAPCGVVPPVAAAPRPWAVDDNMRRLASLVVQPPGDPTPAARAPAPGAAPWTDVRGRKRTRNQQATLPAWTIRSGLPTNLAGACFNCTRTCHISAECTYETNRRAGGDRRGGRGQGPAAPTGLPAHQRLGPRKLEPAAVAARTQAPPASRELRVEGGAGNAPKLPMEPVRARYRIPAHQRLGLETSPPRRARAPSPPPVESVGSSIHAHQRLGGRDLPAPHPLQEVAPPPAREAAGLSSRPPARDRSVGAGPRGRGAAVGERTVGGAGSADRYPRSAEDIRICGGRLGSRPRQEGLARGAVVNKVFVPRSDEINAAEAALRYALVAFVSGKRAYVTLSEASAALTARVPRAECTAHGRRISCSSAAARECGMKSWRRTRRMDVTSPSVSRLGTASSKRCSAECATAHISSSRACLRMLGTTRRPRRCSAPTHGSSVWERRRQTEKI